MSIDIKEIKRLKDLTGVGLTDAKNALEQSGGDFDKALEQMRKKGLTKAEKRGEREARQGLVATYNHDNRIGVVVELNCETDFVARNEIFGSLAKDIAMHIAASNPEYLSIDKVPSKDIEKIKAEFLDKAKETNKPKEMIENIVDNQVKKYFAEKCLLDQSFIKDPDMTIADFVKENIAKLGENIVIRKFSRIALGEVVE